MQLPDTERLPLAKLDLRGRLASIEVVEIQQAYQEAFLAMCARHGLDPQRTSLDFDTGEVKTWP